MKISDTYLQNTMLQAEYDKLKAINAELLEALKELMRCHDIVCEGAKCNWTGVDAARAAIAKAEGK